MKILKIFEEKLRYKNYSEKSMTLVNQLSLMMVLKLFSLFGFPIHGEYDDYG